MAEKKPATKAGRKKTSDTKAKTKTTANDATLNTIASTEPKKNKHGGTDHAQSNEGNRHRQKRRKRPHIPRKGR